MVQRTLRHMSHVGWPRATRPRATRATANTRTLEGTPPVNTHAPCWVATGHGLLSHICSCFPHAWTTPVPAKTRTLVHSPHPVPVDALAPCWLATGYGIKTPVRLHHTHRSRPHLLTQPPLCVSHTPCWLIHMPHPPWTPPPARPECRRTAQSTWQPPCRCWGRPGWGTCSNQ